MATPTCSAADVAVDTQYTVVGAGFPPAAALAVTVVDQFNQSGYSVVADDTGGWTVLGHAFAAGTYTVTVYKAGHTGHNPQASCTFTAT